MTGMVDSILKLMLFFAYSYLFFAGGVAFGIGIGLVLSSFGWEYILSLAGGNIPIMIILVSAFIGMAMWPKYVKDIIETYKLISKEKGEKKHD